MSGTAPATLELQGSVGAKSLLGLTQEIGASPGSSTSIPLDSGAILYSTEGVGVNVGDWSISSNTAAELELRVSYNAFTVEIEGTSYSIPYILSNGMDFVASGDLFTDLVRVNGLYNSQDNNGSIYLKRTDSETYPPSFAYNTVITFQLESN